LAPGRQVRRPIRRFYLAAGDYAVQGPFRARRRKDVELDDEAANAIEDRSDDPEVTAQKKDTSQALRKCLGALSPEHREIVDLVYYHEKSVEEVAEIVGIPENTVKTRLFYARKKLAELLKAAGVERGWP
jgi:RNA polymerase sigma-70 factor, ECF subfamily